jgi:hypothetical protein
MAEMEIEFLLWVDIWDGEVHHIHKMLRMVNSG